MLTRKSRGWIVIDQEECKGCGLCVAVCPNGCLELVENPNEPGQEAARYVGYGCRADGLCYYACPEPGALTLHKGDPPTPREKNHPSEPPVLTAP